jgi:aspartyl aminopeptidase
VSEIHDFELCLYDTQPAAIGGLNEEFLHSARLDNLMMSFCSIQAITEAVSTVADDEMIRVIALFDNEEVGSTTAHGADSNLLEVTLKRLAQLPFGGELIVSLMLL